MKFLAAVLFVVLSLSSAQAGGLRSVGKWIKEHKKIVLVSAATVGAGFAARGLSGSIASRPVIAPAATIPISRGESPVTINPVGGRR